jgi:hypothetical protein
LRRIDPLLSGDSVNGGRCGNARDIHGRNNRITVSSMARATAVSGQLLCKHVPAATVTKVIIEEQCFLCGLCRDIMANGKVS